MGKFNVQVTLRNSGDVTLFKRGFIAEKDIRQATVEAVVDTGAPTMVITEKIREKLGLGVKKTGFVGVADGGQTPCKRTEAVEVQWEQYSTDCYAIVLDRGDHCLLGAIPLEGMTLRINPREMRLEPIYTSGIMDEVFIMGSIG